VSDNSTFKIIVQICCQTVAPSLVNKNYYLIPHHLLNLLVLDREVM